MSQIDDIMTDPVIWDITLGHIVAVGVLVAVGLYILSSRLEESVEEMDSYDEKALDEITKPHFKDIVARYGQPVDRYAKHGRTVIGYVQQHYEFNLKKSDVYPNVSEGSDKDGDISVEALLLRPEGLVYNLLDRFWEIPDFAYTVEIWPSQHITDKDYIELDRAVNMTRIGGVYLADTFEAKHTVMNAVWKETAEDMAEGIPNFLRRLTHFDVSQAKKTDMAITENKLEQAKWNSRDQRDVENM